MTPTSDQRSGARRPPDGATSPLLPNEARAFGEAAMTLAGLAARLLGWRPDEFWRATPAELASALRDEAVELVSGGELVALMERFPDKVD